MARIPEDLKVEQWNCNKLQSATKCFKQSSPCLSVAGHIAGISLKGLNETNPSNKNCGPPFPHLFGNNVGDDSVSQECSFWRH